jgi:secondary thiamine-phosphate synthase enzyme
MPTLTRTWSFDLKAEFGTADITSEVHALVQASGVRDGVVAIGLVGSTGGITTIEYESGALNDLRRAVESLAPADAHYDHNARWGDGNGFSHVRSALVGTDLAVPVTDGSAALGTWQQVVVINFDNRARTREVVATVTGQ